MPYYDYKCANDRCPSYDVKKTYVFPIDHIRPECFMCRERMQQIIDPKALVFKGPGWTPKSGGGRSE